MKALLQRKGVVVPSRERADAKRQEDDVTLWRDYRAFLDSKLTLFNAHISEARVAFERADAHEEEAKQAQSILDRIPAGIRALFEYVLEERRQRAQGELEIEARANHSRHIDPDIIERRALTDLLNESEGNVEAENTPKGYGWFPRGTPGDVRWYALDVAELLAAPTAASYTIATDHDDAHQRIMRSVLAGLALGIFLIIWFLLPRAQPTRDGNAYAPIASGSTTNRAISVTPIAMEVWSIQRAILTLVDGQHAPIAIAATTQSTWPPPTETQRAYWQRNAFVPLRLCFTPDLIEKMTALQLVGEVGAPERVYSISANQSSTTNLIIESCRSNTMRRYGTLQQTLPIPLHPIGKPVVLLGEETITVRSIEIVGPGQDSTLPIGQSRIVVTVAARSDMDWPAYAPTLLLSSGQAYLPAETLVRTTMVELRYLVPLPSVEGVVAWDITIPGDRHMLRWRTTLAPPTSRIDALRGILEVLNVTPRIHDGALTIAITITNHSRAALQLSSDDIVLLQSERRITTPDTGLLTTPLAPGERRMLILSIPRNPQPLTLTIGTQSYLITA